MAAKAAQYVTIIDRSNKVIKQSSQFKDLFTEAKSAYITRKAEIKERKKLREEVELRKAIRNVSLEEQSVRDYSPRPGYLSRQGTDRDGRPGPRASPGDSGPNTPTGQPRHINLAEFNDELNSARRNPPAYRDPYADLYAPQQGLVRSYTDQQLTHQSPNRPPIPRPYSQDDLDIDGHLAYGDHYPEDLVAPRDTPKQANQKEFSSLVLKAKILLDEANCAGHSAKAIIGHLQKNPDTMAAVGLTLAEISKVLPKLAPGALATLGKSAPAVMALLLSPEFLIAVGVAAGVTVIAIGGYKIIKRIKEKAASDKEDQRMEEAIDLRELEHVERWRRGVEPTMIDDGASVISGTSVEGEYITPYAAQSIGHLPRSAAEASRERPKKSKTPRERSEHDGDKKKKHRQRPSADDDTVTSRSDAGSRRGLRRSSTHDDSNQAVVKAKKPSPLARMFTTRD